MVVTNVNSNSVISSEVMNWHSFVGEKSMILLHTLYFVVVLCHSACMNFFLVNVFGVLHTCYWALTSFPVWPWKHLHSG